MRGTVTARVRATLAIALIAALVPSAAVATTFPAAAPAAHVSAGAPAARDHVLVRLKDPSAEKLSSKLRALRTSGRALRTAGAGPALVKVPAGKTRDVLLAELERDPDVLYAVPDYVRRPLAYTPPNDPDFNDPTTWIGSGGSMPYAKSWWVRDIGAPQVWAHGYSDPADRDFPVRAPGGNFTVAVIDTGFYMDHPDRGNILAGRDLFQRYQGGVFYEDNDVTPPSPSAFPTGGVSVTAHGTCVAGEIAAATGNGIGMAGVGYDARVLVYKIAGIDVDGVLGVPAGQAIMVDDRLIAAIYRAADDGAKVINMSVGGAEPSAALQEAVDYAWGKGAILVAATGNDGTQDVLYPAACDKVLGVGSYNGYGGTRTASSFSSHGPGLDVLAPGEMMWSLYKPDAFSGHATGYTFWTGTSMAAPAAAGAIAHLWRYQPALTNTEIVDFVEQNTRPGTIGWSDTKGYGFLSMPDVLAAFISAYPYLGRPTIAPVPPAGAGPVTLAWSRVVGRAVSYDVSVDGVRATSTASTSAVVSLGWGPHAVAVAPVSSYNWYDASSVATATVFIGPIPDDAPPGGWTAFGPAWAATSTPTVSVRVRDAASGLRPASAEFRSDRGTGWSAWAAASATGPDYSTATETISARLPATAEGTAAVQFRVTDGSSLVGTSPVFVLAVDVTRPAGVARIAPGSVVTTRAVSLESTVTDANLADMRVSVNGGRAWGSWESYGASRPMTLPDGRGLKTVVAEYRDRAGNVLSLAATTTLDLPSRVDRIAGTDRYRTAVEISREHFSRPVGAVVVATGERFADALSAAALAGSYDAPLLLTPSRSLHAGVTSEITRLGATNVFVVGGESAVSKTVFDALKAPGRTVRRISGVDRYETCAKIAAEVVSHEQASGRPAPTEVFVARGDSYADALAASPLAYARRMPIVLVKPTTIPWASWQGILAVKPAKAVVAGSDKAIGKAVLDDLRLNGVTPTRVEGADRYATAAAMAAYGVGRGWASWGFVGLAAGTRFPDALGGGVATGREGGVMLLTRTGDLPPATGAALRLHAPDVGIVNIFGGEGAVGGAVFGEVSSLL